MPGELTQDFLDAVETGSAITWKYPSCAGGDNPWVSFTRWRDEYMQQAEGTKMVHVGKNPQHDYFQGHFSGTLAE